jgi:hypothetical protein
MKRRERKANLSMHTIHYRKVSVVRGSRTKGLDKQTE